MSRWKSRRPLRLEEPEEVLTLVQRLLEPVRPYLKWIGAGVAVVAVALAAWGVISQVQAGREDRAGAALAQVQAKYAGKDADAEAAKALETVAREYSGTKAGQEAELNRAHLLYRLKQYAEAAKAYESLARSGDPSLGNLVAESLSYCYEGMGDFQKAAQVLKPAADSASGPLQSQLYWHLAMLLERAGDAKEATRYWSKILAEPPPGLDRMIPYLKEKVAVSRAAAKAGEKKADQK
jgi:predicted negative regulator of RcsB-dependent stress response